MEVNNQITEIEMNPDFWKHFPEHLRILDAEGCVRDLYRQNRLYIHPNNEHQIAIIYEDIETQMKRMLTEK